MTPDFSLKSITFSGGETILLEPDSLNVIVGANNCGKTTCLHEIARWLADTHFKNEDFNEPPPQLVVSTMETQRSGTTADIEAWLRENVYFGPAARWPIERCFRWLGQDCPPSRVKPSWESDRLGRLAAILCAVVDVEDRLSMSRPQESIESYRESPEHPIHVLAQDDRLELAISISFKSAFHTDLILKRAGGKTNSLHVGDRSALGETADRAAPNYLKKLAAYPRLADVGHGMRSFAGCLLHVYTSPAFVQLIDEPEVFLHPPHSRLLGTLLACEKRPSRQLIIATHSADFLRGVIDSGHERVKVVRITRDKNVNHAYELNTTQLRSLWADPIVRFSNILDGLFHDKVIVCEGDSDCRFYAAVAQALHTEELSATDILWTWTNGKDRLPTVIAALAALHVQVRAVADFDMLRAEQPLREIVRILGGNWQTLRDEWESVKNSIESKFKQPTPSEVRSEINDALGEEHGPSISKRGLERIRQSLRAASGWDLAKLSGTSGVPGGQPTESLRGLLGKLRDLGLFVVECGELERFVSDVGGKGPQWVSDVLNTKDLANDPALETARKFVSDLLSTQNLSARSSAMTKANSTGCLPTLDRAENAIPAGDAVNRAKEKPSFVERLMRKAPDR